MHVIKINFLIPFVSTHTYGVANPLIYVLISPCIRYASSVTWKCWHRCQLKPSTYLLLIRFARLHVHVRKQHMLGRARYNFTCLRLNNTNCMRKSQGYFHWFWKQSFSEEDPVEKISYSWKEIQGNTKVSLSSTKVLRAHYLILVHHHHHMFVMELGHLLTRSGLTYPEVSSKVYHDSFCQLGSSISLPWVICFEAFYLHVVSSFPCIPVICPKLVLFLTLLQFVHLFCNSGSFRRINTHS